MLQSTKNKTLYKGLTNNLDQRISQHFLGKSRTTKKMLPLKLIHVEICKSRGEARNLEKFFKSGFGREILKEIAKTIII